MKLVLSIDGGGIRGIIPAMVLNELETRSARLTGRSWDLIAGTSTGGILSLCLTKVGRNSAPAYTAADLIQFYLGQGPKIFSRSWLRTLTSVNGVFNEKYSNTNLKEALKQRLGSSLLAEATTDVLVTAYDLESRQPKFFKSMKAKQDPAENFVCWEAALSTASAPTYFSPATIVDEFGHILPLVDGGVFSTNVALCAYAEAKKMWPDEEIFVFSIGCGELVGPYSWKKLCTGELGWIVPLLDIMFQGSSVTVDYQMRQLTPNYRRLQRRLKYASDAMDDASDANLKNLQREAQELIQENDAVLTEVANLVKARA